MVHQQKPVLRVGHDKLAWALVNFQMDGVNSTIIYNITTQNNMPHDFLSKIISNFLNLNSFQTIRQVAFQ